MRCPECVPLSGEYCRTCVARAIAIVDMDWKARAETAEAEVRKLRAALEADQRAVDTTQAVEMGVLPYETAHATAAAAWDVADKLREAALK